MATMDVMIEQSLSEKLNESELIAFQLLISQISEKVAAVLPGLLAKRIVLSQVSASNTTLKSIKTNDIIPAMFIKAMDKDTKKIPMVILTKQSMMRMMIDAIMGLEEKQETSYQFDEFDFSTAQEMITRLFQDSAQQVSELANKPVRDLAPSMSVFKNFGDFLQTMRLTSDAAVTQIQMTIQVEDTPAVPIMVVLDFKAMIKFIQDLGELIPSAVSQPEPAPTPISVHAEEVKIEAVPDVSPIVRQEEPPVVMPKIEPASVPVTTPVVPAAAASVAAPVIREPVPKAATPAPVFAPQLQMAAPEPEPFFSVPVLQDNSALLMNVPLTISVEIGQTRRKIKEILEFQPGTIIELDKQTGTPMDIIVDGSLFARGDVVVVDENFGVRITELSEQRKQLRQK